MKKVGIAVLLLNIVGACCLGEEPWGYLRWMAFGGWTAALCFYMQALDP